MSEPGRGGEERDRSGEPTAVEEKAGERKPASPVRRLLEALTGAGDGAEPQPRGQVIAPVSIERLLESLLESPVGEEEEEPERRRVSARAREILGIVQRLARSYIEMYMRDGLGRIYHPLYGGTAVEARLGELAQMLAKTIHSIWSDAAKLFREHGLAADEFARFIHEAQAATELSYLVLVEVYARLLTIYYTNAPPELRPPLVNAALGYEIVGTGHTYRRRQG